MLKVLQVKIQEEGIGSRIQNMPGSTDQEEGSTNQDAFLQNLILVQESIKPIK